MKKTWLFLGLLTAAACSADSAAAQAREASAGQIKAAFVFNIAKFARWDPPPAGELVICTVGKGEVVEALRVLLPGKTVGDLPVSVVESGVDLTGCTAVFVSKSERDRFADILEQAATKPILTIGEDPSFLESGGMVSLFVKGRRVRFAVNRRALADVQVSLTAKLLQLAEEGPR